MEYALSNPVYIFLPCAVTAAILFLTAYFIRRQYSSWVVPLIVGGTIAAANDMLITPLLRNVFARFISNNQYVILLSVSVEIIIYLLIYFIIDKFKIVSRDTTRTSIWLVAAAVQTFIMGLSETLKRLPLLLVVNGETTIEEVIQKQIENSSMSEEEQMAYAEELARQLLTSNVGMVLFSVAFFGFFLSFLNFILSFRSYKNKTMDFYFPLLGFVSTVVIFGAYNMMIWNLLSYDSFAIVSCALAVVMIIVDIIFCIENKLWLKLKKDRV